MNLPVEQRQEWIRSRREQRKLARRARLRRQILRYILLAVLMLTAAGGFYYSPWYLSGGSDTIVVRGNRVVSNEQIREALKFTHDVPIYKLAPEKLENSIAQLSIVKRAFVRRYALPHPKLVVEILEEFPWASYSNEINTPAEYVIAESGRLVSIAEFPKVIQPSLLIIGPASLQLTSKQVNQWATWIAYIEKQSQRTVQSIDLRRPQDIVVQVDDLTLKLGAADISLNKRLTRLASVLRIIQPWKNKLDYIDLSLDSNIPLKLTKKVDSTAVTEHSNPPRSQL